MKPYIKRISLDLVEKKLEPNKVLMLLGARRVGKTELIKAYLKKWKEGKYLFLNGEDLKDAALLRERTASHYNRLLAGTALLVIDEAQRVPDIGMILKLIVDTVDGISVIATGSSVFDLSNRLGEPLVGRKKTVFLYPLSQMEFGADENFRQTTEKLEERLLFGGYPELERYASWDNKQDYIYEMINSYLLKDILAFEGVRQADKIYDLLRLVAWQVGKEVSLSELANQLQLARNTVERYLGLLTKVFVLFKIEGFSRNLRKEVTKSSRWYFYDNGIRNGIINNFNRLAERNDVGELWENYLAVERLKKQHYSGMHVRNYFWRTYDMQELDWLEERSGGLYGYEFKWSDRKGEKTRIPASFLKTYPEAGFEVIDRKNYLDFIL